MKHQLNQGGPVVRKVFLANVVHTGDDKLRKPDYREEIVSDLRDAYKDSPG